MPLDYNSIPQHFAPGETHIRTPHISLWEIGPGYKLRVFFCRGLMNYCEIPRKTIKKSIFRQGVDLFDRESRWGKQKNIH